MYAPYSMCQLKSSKWWYRNQNETQKSTHKKETHKESATLRAANAATKWFWFVKFVFLLVNINFKYNLFDLIGYVANNKPHTEHNGLSNIFTRIYANTNSNKSVHNSLRDYHNSSGK